jgi:hypothetical protein
LPKWVLNWFGQIIIMGFLFRIHSKSDIGMGYLGLWTKNWIMAATQWVMRVYSHFNHAMWFFNRWKT